MGGIGECNLSHGWGGHVGRRSASRLDMGVDVLQALQFNAEGMDPATLKQQTGDRYALTRTQELVSGAKCAIILFARTHRRQQRQGLRLLST